MKTKNNYLDLTNNNWKHNPKWKYVFHKFVTRPYKKWAVIVAILIILTAIIPIMNFFAVSLVGSLCDCIMVFGEDSFIIIAP